MARKRAINERRIRALAKENQEARNRIEQKRERNLKLRGELEELEENAEMHLEREVQRERKRLEDIVLKGIEHVLEEQSDLIDK